MSRSFALIFWGLVLTILDFRVNGFDLLPDLMGYLLVALGCEGLALASPRFQMARLIAWILAIFEVYLFFAKPVDPMVTLAAAILSVVMVWSLLGGIMQVATDLRRPDLAASASNRRIVYAVLMAACHLSPFLVEIASDGSLVAVILLGCTLVALFLVLHIIHRMKRETRGGGGGVLV